MQLLLENWRKFLNKAREEEETEEEDAPAPSSVVTALMKRGGLSRKEAEEMVKKKIELEEAEAMSARTGDRTQSGILEDDKDWKNRLRNIVFGSNWQSREEYEASEDKKAAADKKRRTKAARDPLAGKNYQLVNIKDFELSPAPRNVRDWLGDFLYVTPDQIPDNALVNPDTGELASELYDRMNKGDESAIQAFMSNRGGQMLGALQDYDGDGHISNEEASVHEFEDTDEETGLRILPLRWSVAYGVLLDRWGESPEK